MSSAPAAEQPAVDKLRQLLHRRFKRPNISACTSLPCPADLSAQVQLHGGRTVVGDFSCMDPQGNLILVNTCELVNATDGQGLTERCMGMVLIPKAQQAEVLLQTTTLERVAMLSLVS